MAQEDPSMLDEDVIAYKMAVTILQHMDPFGFGHIMAFITDIGVPDVTGFAEEAMSNIDPKDALCPALAFLAATPHWRKVQPELKAKLRERTIEVELARAAGRPRSKLHA